MHILLVEDEATLAIPLSDALQDQGHDVVHIADGASALSWLSSNLVDLVISDIRLPHGDGMQILQRARQQQPPAEVLMMTGFATVEQAVQALHSGAYNYLQKPFSTESFLSHVAKMCELRELQQELTSMRADVLSQVLLSGKSNEISIVNQRLQQWADQDLTVLITGRSGTGKERSARALHQLSQRKELPFVAVSCAAIPSSLFEGELFGYRKGAFSGADADHHGLLHSVSGGTLFLDDIDDFPLELQPKMLRVLQESEFIRLGDTRPQKFSGRVVAATKRALPELVSEAKFREDLYHRLNVLNLELPELNSRLEDLPLLLADLLNRWDIEGRYSVSNTALKQLSTFSWPGNVRELENALRRAIALSGRARVLRIEHFMPVVGQDNLQVGDQLVGLREITARAETEAILNALELTGGRKAKAAELLGITRKVLWSKMGDLGMGQGK
ncbi:MAG: sigma-54-dependent Fis family transcriptional regulator [Planctomycetes bacterium]|nr:sigma-54-dependent Fis family transcriptional regulator [Planctomycetota bacterium]